MEECNMKKEICSGCKYFNAKGLMCNNKLICVNGNKHEPYVRLEMVEKPIDGVDAMVAGFLHANNLTFDKLTADHITADPIWAKANPYAVEGFINDEGRIEIRSNKEKTMTMDDVRKEFGLDMVNHPGHYKAPNGMEAIDVIEAFTANLKGIEATDTGNIIKYILRWKEKNGIEDLRKIIWYANHLINHLEKEGK